MSWDRFKHNTKNNLFALISCVCSVGAFCEDPDPPELSIKMKDFCASAPYDCDSDKIVTSYLLNDFMYQFYLEVENYFVSLGFDNAQFEFCIYNRRGCLAEGVSVKNSAYKIAKIFPKRKDYYNAFGGVNQNVGVYFFKDINEKDSQAQCSLKVRQGNAISKKLMRAIETEKIKTLADARRKYYKKYSMFYAQYLPSLYSLESSDQMPPGECWLQYKNKRLIFEINQEMS